MVGEEKSRFRRFLDGDWEGTRPACSEEREALLNCVLTSKCFAVSSAENRGFPAVRAERHRRELQAGPLHLRALPAEVGLLGSQPPRLVNRCIPLSVKSLEVSVKQATVFPNLRLQRG